MSNKWGSHLRGTFSGRLARGLRSRGEGDEGASLVEYALLLALIAVVAIGALTFLGKTVSGTLNNVGNTIALGGSGGASGPVFTGADHHTALATYTIPGFNAGLPGTPYQFYASGTGPTTFSSSDLPAPFSLSTSGLLTGTPTTTGTITFTVTASNSSGSGSHQFTLTPGSPSAPVFSLPTSPSATFVLGTPQTVTFTASPATSITESGTLPNGLSFSGGVSSGTATISGTATGSPSGPTQVTVTAHNGATTTQMVFSITVSGVSPTITSANSANATYNKYGGNSFSFTITTSGTLPLTGIDLSGAGSCNQSGFYPSTLGWSGPTCGYGQGAKDYGAHTWLTATLDTSAGTETLSGKLPDPGYKNSYVYNFTITATNSYGSSSPRPFTLTVTRSN